MELLPAPTWPPLPSKRPLEALFREVEERYLFYAIELDILMVVWILSLEMGVTTNPDMAILTLWKPLGWTFYRSLVNRCGLYN